MSDDRLSGLPPRSPATPGKPTDPATRLADLLAQSLEELTKPFDPPETQRKQDPTKPAAEAEAQTPGGTAPGAGPAAMPQAAAKLPDEITLQDIEQALAAAATRPTGIPPPDEPEPEKAEQGKQPEPAEPAAAVTPSPPTVPAPEPEVHPEAARVVARVRRLMVVSMLITIIGVGSVLGVIGYRIWKAQERPAEPGAPADVTLTLPGGVKVVNAGVAEDRLVLTLEVAGKIQVRTYDLKTLQPAGRLGFTTSP